MARRRYLVAYDIRDDRRLRAVHETMQGFGDRLQYSVFLCDLDSVERIELRASLRAVMNEAEDAVMIVDLGEARVSLGDRWEFIGPPPPLPGIGPTVL